MRHTQRSNAQNKILILTAHTSILCQYIKQKYKWNIKTIDSISHRVLYRPIIHINQIESVMIHKFVFDRLPTSCKENKNYEYS